MPLLGSIGLVLVMVGGMLTHYAYENWKVRRCDACRLEAQQKGRSTVFIAHRCSPKRFLYRKED